MKQFNERFFFQVIPIYGSYIETASRKMTKKNPRSKKSARLLKWRSAAPKRQNSYWNEINMIVSKSDFDL